MCLSSASFELCKCVANNEKHESKGTCFNLALLNQTFAFDFKNLNTLAIDLKPTKQNILRIRTIFYDPIGLIYPIILQLRLIFHKICAGKYDWDTEPPSKFLPLWNKLIKGLKVLQRVPVSFHVLCKCRNKNTDISGFYDSSGEAYAACIYILSRCYYGIM